MTEMDGLRSDGDTTTTTRSPQIVIARLQNIARQLADTALDLLFPPRCINCSRAGTLLCGQCQADLRPAEPVSDTDGLLLERRATAIFEGAIRKALHALKYENQYRFADILGARLYEEYKRANWSATLFTAAPLHPNRMRTRGYNQAALLGEQLARRVGKPFAVTALHRLRDTQSQVGLGYQERQANVADAFEADPAQVKDHRIVIVDDVYTTGATLRACANALRQAGATDVWGLTVASASHDALT